MQQLLILDELDTWSQDNYPDLVRALMLAKQQGIFVLCVSGTTLTSNFTKETELWMDLIQCNMVNYT